MKSLRWHRLCFYQINYRKQCVQSLYTMYFLYIWLIPADKLWVNPDCGLKTRHWEETEKALVEMINAAKQMRVAVEVF